MGKGYLPSQSETLLAAVLHDVRKLTLRRAASLNKRAAEAALPFMKHSRLHAVADHVRSSSVILSASGNIYPTNPDVPVSAVAPICRFVFATVLAEIDVIAASSVYVTERKPSDFEGDRP